MLDYDELYNKVEDLKLRERRLTDQMEAVSEIRGDGIEATIADIMDKIYELRENRRQVEALMETAKKQEDAANSVDVPVWRDQ